MASFTGKWPVAHIFLQFLTKIYIIFIENDCSLGYATPTPLEFWHPLKKFQNTLA